jgi:hypothetical protein
MSDIYSGAAYVIAWLGQSFYDISVAFTMIAGPQKLTFPHSQDTRHIRSGRQWKALARLLNRPYWTRVWIIQEFLFAKSLELWCGEHKAAWSDVEHICWSLKCFEDKGVLNPASQLVIYSC